MDKTKGFTLLEIIVSITIFTAITAIALSLTMSSRDAWFIGSTSLSLRQEIMKTLMQMEKELKDTRSSKTNLTVGSSTSSLSFKIPQVTNGSVLDSSGNIIWSNSIVYSLNNASQLLRNDSVTTKVLANNVTTLVFTRPTSPVNILQINLTAQKTSPTRRVLQDNEQISIKMRN